MDADHIRDIFSGFGPVTVRRMFGGSGIYADGVMIALVADEIIYLKADGVTAAAFEQEGLAPFTFAKKSGLQMVTSYRRMPDRCFDDPDEMAVWARRALEAARRSASKVKKAARGAPVAKRPKRKRSTGKSKRRLTRR